MKITICSKPDHINFDCPHCGERVDVPYDKVDFNNKSYWWDGGSVVCPNCNKEVEFDDCEYD